MKNNKSHITTKEDQQDLDYIYNNGIAIELNNIEKIYRNIQCVYDENALSNINAQLNVINEEDDITANITNKDLNKLKPRQRYDYTGGLLHRNNELFHDSEISIFSQAVMGYNMSDYAKWDIEGEETLLDRPCTKIHGNLNNIDKLTHSETFTAWIDKETGVVLKYYEEDGNGKHTSGFETTHINYNNTLDENMFIINYDEYSEKTFPGR